jgi:hypothetical protein
MNSKTNKILNWIDYVISINNQIFTKDLLKNNLNKFWVDIMDAKLNDNQHIWLLFRLQWSNGEYVTIGKLQKLNKVDKEYLLNYILNMMEDKSEYYKSASISSIIFSYNIKKGLAKDKIEFTGSKIQFQDYQHHKLPITINPLEYGKLIKQIANTYFIQVNETNIAIISQFDNYNEIEFYRSGLLIYKYKDTIINENSFIRDFGNKKFHFIDNEIKLLTVKKPVKYTTKLKINKNLNNKIITLDIETYINNDVHIPYCISW